jgi:hypothetical protein
VIRNERRNAPAMRKKRKMRKIGEIEKDRET